MTLAESIELLGFTINKSLMFPINMSEKSRTASTKYGIFKQTLNEVYLFIYLLTEFNYSYSRLFQR